MNYVRNSFREQEGDINWVDCRNMILQRTPGTEFYSLSNQLRAIVITATVFPVKDSSFEWMVDTKVLRSIWAEYKQMFVKSQTINIMYAGGLDLATRGLGVPLEDYSHEQLRAMVDYHLDTHPEMSNDEHDRYDVICRLMERVDPKAHLRKLMTILDDNHTEIPEGLYLELSSEIMRLWNAI